MKQTVKLSLCICLIAMSIIVACRKSYTNGTPIYDMSHLNQLFSALRSIPQNLYVNAGRDTIVYGSKGTILHFYTNSFLDAPNGNVISNGQVYLQLVEMYKPGDMIANHAATVDVNGNPLTSGGQVSIVATKNGQTVYANKYGIGFPQPAASTQPMNLYYGSTPTVDSIVKWTQSTASVGTSLYGSSHFDSTVEVFFFDSSSSFQFINCDYFWHIDPMNIDTTLTVQMPDTSFNDNNTVGFLIFQSINCAMPSWMTFKNSINYTTFKGLPIGMNYQLVIITNKNGNWYYFQQEGVIARGMSINANMTPESQTYIKSKLSAL